jgi:hypothetical protein
MSALSCGGGRVSNYRAESMFEKIVTMTPAFDKRHTDPTKNYGVHGVDLRMVLKGPLGATQFVLYTGWHLPHVQAEFDRKAGGYDLRKPLPADIGYHWREPRYEGQTPIQESCEYCDGQPCFYDGSSLQAEDVYKILLTEGSEGVWRELENRYNELAAR